MVVYAAEVQDAVDDDTVQFLVEGSPKQFGIGAHGVQRNIRVANEHVSLAVVKADMVGVVVVAYELAVDAQYFLVVHKNIVYQINALAVGTGNIIYPEADLFLVQLGQGYVDGVECDHSSEIYSSISWMAFFTMSSSS